MPRGLSLKRQLFIAEYMANGGHGTKAAIKAGYSPNSASSTASEILGSPEIQAKLAQNTRLAAIKSDLTQERVLEYLEEARQGAMRAEQYGPVIKATELLGKHLGMFIDRSISMNINLNGSHLEALAALVDRREPVGEDDVFEVSGSSLGAFGGLNREARASLARSSIVDNPQTDD